MFRSLDALVGGDAAAMRQWFRAVNDHLGGIPVERAQTVQGLVELAGYLDAMRGRYEFQPRQFELRGELPAPSV